MKVAHHGARSSTPEEFLQAVRPSFAILSCGRGNRYGHPHEELMTRLAAVGAVPVATMDCGAASVTTDGKRYTVKAFSRPLNTPVSF